MALGIVCGYPLRKTMPFKAALFIFIVLLSLFIILILLVILLPCMGLLLPQALCLRASV